MIMLRAPLHIFESGIVACRFESVVLGLWELHRPMALAPSASSDKHVKKKEEKKVGKFQSNYQTQISL
jgi:hypothetical protein